MIKQWMILLLVVSALASKGNKQVSTIVTGLWDIKRGDLKGDNKRPFEYYLDHFKVLLETETNLIIFGSKELKLFVEKHRKRPNYVFIERELEWFEKMWHNPLIEKIRKKYSETRVDWQQMTIAAQYGLYLYNAVVMAKIFLMREALQYDKWNSDFFIWQDGGINHGFQDFTTNEIVISPVNLIEQLAYLFPWHFNSHFWIAFRKDVDHQYITFFRAWANYFYLYTQTMTDFAGAYQNMLRIHLQEYDMKTEQAIITYMYDRYPYLVPVVHLLLADMISHRFDVDSYFQRRARSVRRFSFGRQFETVAKEMQQEKEVWSELQRGRRKCRSQQEAACVEVLQRWLVPHSLAYIKVKSLKYVALLCFLLYLLRKVRRSKKQQNAYLPFEDNE